MKRIQTQPSLPGVTVICRPVHARIDLLTFRPFFRALLATFVEVHLHRTNWSIVGLIFPPSWQMITWKSQLSVQLDFNFQTENEPENVLGLQTIFIISPLILMEMAFIFNRSSSVSRSQLNGRLSFKLQLKCCFNCGFEKEEPRSAPPVSCIMFRCCSLWQSQ